MNETPQWWLDVFPNTYVKFIPMKNSYEIRVFYWQGNTKMRFDYKPESPELFESLEQMFVDVAMKMLYHITD